MSAERGHLCPHHLHLLHLHLLLYLHLHLLYLLQDLQPGEAALQHPTLWSSAEEDVTLAQEQLEHMVAGGYTADQGQAPPHNV